MIKYYNQLTALKNNHGTSHAMRGLLLQAAAQGFLLVLGVALDARHMTRLYGGGVF